MIYARIALFLFWTCLVFWIGGQHCRMVAAEAAAKASASALKTQVTDSATITKEETARDAALNAPIVAPDVRLCRYAPIVPSPARASSFVRRAPELRSPNPEITASAPDIGPALADIGRHADVQVTALRDYVERVCLHH